MMRVLEGGEGLSGPPLEKKKKEKWKSAGMVIDEIPELEGREECRDAV